MAEELNKNVQSQIDRMKHMMNYGLKTENKQPYRSVEHERVGADGNRYAIIREGAKFYIKVSDKKRPLKEDYNYIGGFQNHKDYQYDSYANALKNFDLKMTSINEACDKRGKVESWDVNGRENIIAEASNKMKLEIARQREIMKNAANILEGKEVCKDCQEKQKEYQKNNVNLGSANTGTPTGNGGDFFTEKPHGSDLENIDELEGTNLKGKQKPKVGNKKTLGESVEECGSKLNEEDDEVTSEEDIEVDTPDGEEDVDFSEDDLDFDDEDLDDEEDDLEEFSDEDDLDFDDEDLDDESGDDVTELKAEIEGLKTTIDAIADKLGVSEFDEDEPLYPEYDDENDFEEDEYEVELDDEDGDDFEEDDYEVELDDDDFEEEDDEVEVYESRAYRKAMMNEDLKHAIKHPLKYAKNKGRQLFGKNSNELAARYEQRFGKPNYANQEGWDEYEENKNESRNMRRAMDETTLHVWGKHPRYQKEPFTYPNPTMSKTQGQWEAGDENSPSKGKKPYAKTVGNPKPYGEGESPKVAANSIAESIIKQLKNQ